jgi:hypothetical protein
MPVGACSSAVLSLARFPLSIELLIHLSSLQLGQIYACLFICLSVSLLPTLHVEPEIMILLDEHNPHFFDCHRLTAIILSKTLNTK